MRCYLKTKLNLNLYLGVASQPQEKSVPAHFPRPKPKPQDPHPIPTHSLRAEPRTTTHPQPETFQEEAPSKKRTRDSGTYNR